MRALAGANLRTDEPAPGRLARTKQLRKLASENVMYSYYPAVVVPRGSSRSELDAPRSDAFLRVVDQRVNVIGRDHGAGNRARHAIVRY
mgnify:FL=1